jgi:LuxR family maltose regulon positive regulatory protein
MAKLLYKVAAQSTAGVRAYAERLLAAYYRESSGRLASQAKTLPGGELVEPLSERELEVLRLAAAGKSNQEIAAELVIAVGTVKKHLNTIFGKLSASSRTQAIARARELELL